jgi:hypothetical protein
MQQGIVCPTGEKGKVASSDPRCSLLFGCDLVVVRFVLLGLVLLSISPIGFQKQSISDCTLWKEGLAVNYTLSLCGHVMRFSWWGVPSLWGSVFRLDPCLINIVRTVVCIDLAGRIGWLNHYSFLAMSANACL